MKNQSVNKSRGSANCCHHGNNTNRKKVNANIIANYYNMQVTASRQSYLLPSLIVINDFTRLEDES
ncbi:MAG: hypothetical protein GF308_13750 [Candidatus Heimdallarchaeota archaeon]|nr:hypothetical protein [Candidatus Heimdallarchaeota archaeon]